MAAQTDGIIFHLWPDVAKVPTGVVGHPVRRTQASEIVSQDFA